MKMPSSSLSFFFFPPQQRENHYCNRKLFKMASDLTFTEGVAVAALVFTILAVLLVLPYLVVAFGFFPDSAFAGRVYPSIPSNKDIVLELRRLHCEVEKLRKTSESQVEWAEIQTDTVVTIGETLIEKMD
jgi:hypothetical protein